MPRAPLFVLLCLVLALAACGPASVLTGRSCIRGPVPSVGRPVPDEAFALMRRELDRAERSPPLVRARMLEDLHLLFPDVSDLANEPRCHDELEAEGIESIDRSPVEFSRLLVARVRSIHDAKALMALAARDESAVTEYRLLAEETGPAPARSFLRYLALANIPSYWVADNVAEGRQLMLDRLRKSQDAIELYLLHGAENAVFDQALWGHPAQAVGEDAPSLMALRLSDVKRRVHGAPDRAALELVIVELADVGQFGVRFGVERDARALVNEILAAKGEVPLTRGVPGAARDLAEVARAALFDLDTPQKSIGGFDLPPPRRARWDPRTDWLHREPAGGRVPEDQALARVRDIDSEQLLTNMTSCYLLDQLAKWVPASQGPARFDAILTPAFTGDRKLSTESLCRMRAALGLEGVDEARRVELLVKLLSASPTKPGDIDHSKDEHHAAIAWRAYDDPVRQIGARALVKNLGWVDKSASVRAWLEAQALVPIPLDAPSAETWSLLGRAFDRTLEFHLSGSGESGAKLETAQAILRAWMTSIRSAEAAKDVSHIYVGQVVQARIRALGEYGRRAGLADEIGPFLGERKTQRPAAVALFLLGS